MEQTKLERSYVEKLKPQLNAYVPAHYQSGDIYDKREYKKGYLETNKDKASEYMKKYKQVNKDKLSEYKKEYDKVYREANQDKLKEYDNKYIQCPCCNKLINLHGRTKHYKTKQHIRNASSTTTPSESSESNTE